MLGLTTGGFCGGGGKLQRRRGGHGCELGGRTNSVSGVNSVVAAGCQEEERKRWELRVVGGWQPCGH